MGTATAIDDLPLTYLDGHTGTLAEYRGKVLLVVNVASKCGFTPQYAGLEELYRTYKDRGLVILGFPCNQFMGQEPGTANDIQTTCGVTYGVTFPILAKGDVNGANAHPLYRHLTAARRGFLGTRAVKWNFTKFLLDREGHVVARYSALTKPRKLAAKIETLLG